MDDTTSEIAERVRTAFSQKTPEERFKMGCSMYDTSRYLVTQAILRKNPNISESSLRKELFLAFYRDDFSLDEQTKIISHLETL